MNKEINLHPSTPSKTCIYCNSDSILADKFDTDEFTAWRAINCFNCNKSYLEVFEWGWIEEIELIYDDGETRIYT
jgi:hypothetical protein